MKRSDELFIKKLVGEVKKALFYTDYFSVYYEIIDSVKHRPVGKRLEETNHIERFNCTLGQ